MCVRVVNICEMRSTNKRERKIEFCVRFSSFVDLVNIVSDTRRSIIDTIHTHVNHARDELNSIVSEFASARDHKLGHFA